MKSFRVYDILDSQGQTLVDIIVSMSGDYNLDNIFDEVEKVCGREVESYSYEEIG